MTRFSRLSSAIFLLFLAGCAHPYRHLQQLPRNASALRFQPKFEKELYRCVVDGKILFKKFHLSGLLFFKRFEDGSTRAVFQNEMGISFFDFKWDDRDSFQVVSIMPQLNKPALVKTLKKDFDLLLMKGLDPASERQLLQQEDTLNRFTLDKGYVYYRVHGGQLTAIENAGNRKAVTTIDLQRKKGAHALPESVFFRHHKAHFTIQLNKIDQDAP